jgi:hypothetical protein
MNLCLIKFNSLDPSFTLPTILDNNFKSVPITAMVKGMLGDDEFTNEYNFYDFTPKIPNDQELYYVKIN